MDYSKERKEETAMTGVFMTAAKVLAVTGACMLMSVGLADIIVFIRGSVWRRQRVHILAVVPVEEDDAELEMKVGAARCAVERSGAPGEILLLDAGADEKTKRFCESVFGEVFSAGELTDCVERMTGKRLVRDTEK